LVAILGNQNTRENDMTQGAGIPLTDAELRDTLKAMHEGLLGMQARLDDHQKVIEQMMLVMQNLTAGQVPDGFRQPKKGH
jgi:hypothetical protein